MLERYPSPEASDEERLAQMMGPARALLARVDVMALGAQRAIVRRLLGAVFCLCAALGMAALVPFAPAENRMVIIAAAAFFAGAAGLLAYGIAVLRFDLAPLNAFGQELRAGIAAAERSCFEDPEELDA